MYQRTSSSQAFADPATLTRLLALFLLANALVLNGALWFFSPAQYNETVLQHTWQVLGGDGLDDSWGIMSQALDYVQAPHTTPLYTEIFFNRHIKFQYPPTSLFAVSAMRLVDPGRIRINEIYNGPWPPLDAVAAWMWLITTAAATAALLQLRLREAEPGSNWHEGMVWRAILAVGFTLTFYPLVKAFTLGQIQVWINAMFALALLSWALGWKASSGVLVGLICLIKPHYGLFLVWAAVRSEWRFIAACIATGCLGLAASVAAFGLADNLDYLQVLLYMFQRGEAFYPNQSMNGLLNRLMSISEPQLYGNLEFFIERYAPFNALVYGVTAAFAAIILLLAIIPRNGGQDRVLDFSIMGVSVAMASPIAWEHHYGITLPVFAVVLPRVMRNRSQLICLVASYVLASNYFPATTLLAASYLNIAQSYVLAAVVMLLILLHRLARQGSNTQLSLVHA
jgi:alpha-1,2-mannosyltransferase